MNAHGTAPLRAALRGEAALQLRKLEALGDRHALSLFWEAVAATLPAERRPSIPAAGRPARTGA